VGVGVSADREVELGVEVGDPAAVGTPVVELAGEGSGRRRPGVRVGALNASEMNLSVGMVEGAPAVECCALG
jgi:hypothetical protein